MSNAVVTIDPVVEMKPEIPAWERWEGRLGKDYFADLNDLLALAIAASLV